MVSIIVPNYNHSAYLEDRLNSIFNQTYKNYEVILLDDFSTDNSIPIIQKYEKHPKVKAALYNEKNSGSVFKQWMKGLDYCEGKYIWIAETDDSADYTFLETLVYHLENNQNLVLVYSDALIINEKNIKNECWSNRKNKKFETKRWSLDYINSGKNEICDYLIYGTTINNISAALIRKSAIDDTLKKDLIKFKYVGDWYFYLSLLLKGDLFYCSKQIAFYREHNQNTTKTSLKSGEQFTETIKAYNFFLRQKPRINIDKNRILNYFNYRFTISLKAYDLSVYERFIWLAQLLGKYPNVMLAVFWKWIKHSIKQI